MLRRAPADVEGVNGDSLCRLGAERHRGQRGRRFQRLGHAAAIRCGCAPGACGKSLSRDVAVGAPYKYAVQSRFRGYSQQKSDPYGFWMETPPKSASVVADLSSIQWHDQAWMEQRGETNMLDSPMSVYEVHLGSWMRRMKTISR